MAANINVNTSKRVLVLSGAISSHEEAVTAINIIVANANALYDQQIIFDASAPDEEPDADEEQEEQEEQSEE